MRLAEFVRATHYAVAVNEFSRLEVGFPKWLGYQEFVVANDNRLILILDCGFRVDGHLRPPISIRHNMPRSQFDFRPCAASASRILQCDCQREINNSIGLIPDSCLHRKFSPTPRRNYPAGHENGSHGSNLSET